jgi:hypothetical protein
MTAKERKERQKAKRKERLQKQREEERARRLQAARALLADMTARLKGPAKQRLCAVDVEAWEHKSSFILEVGIACFETATQRFRVRHLVVREHAHRCNGKYVRDNKKWFLYGKSEVLPLRRVTEEVRRELGECHIVVGHCIGGDLGWLRGMGVDVDGTPVVDTQTLAMAQTGDATKTPSLVSLGEQYDLDCRRLHNGANDAAVTLQVMLAQCDASFEKLVGREISQPAVSNAIQQHRARRNGGGRGGRRGGGRGRGQSGGRGRGQSGGRGGGQSGSRGGVAARRNRHGRGRGPRQHRSKQWGRRGRGRGRGGGGA